MGFDFGKELVTGVKRRVLKKVIGGVGDAIRGIPSVGRLDDLKGFGNRSFGKSTKTFKRIYYIKKSFWKTTRYYEKYKR